MTTDLPQLPSDQPGRDLAAAAHLRRRNPITAGLRLDAIMRRQLDADPASINRPDLVLPPLLEPLPPVVPPVEGQLPLTLADAGCVCPPGFICDEGRCAFCAALDPELPCPHDTFPDATVVPDVDVEAVHTIAGQLLADAGHDVQLVRDDQVVIDWPAVADRPLVDVAGGQVDADQPEDDAALEVSVVHNSQVCRCRNLADEAMPPAERVGDQEARRLGLWSTRGCPLHAKPPAEAQQGDERARAWAAFLASCTCPHGTDAAGPHTRGCPNHPEHISAGTAGHLPVLDWRSRHDPRSLAYGVRARGLAGPAVLADVTLDVGPVLDQGPDGECVGFGVVDAINALRATRDADLSGVLPLLGEDDAHALYKRAQQLDDRPGEAYSGTSVLAGMQAAVEAGEIGGYGWAFGTRDIAWTLMRRRPVVIGIPWLSGMFDTGPGGVVDVTGDDLGTGHCLAVVALRLKGPQGQPGPWFGWQQSWGESYGDHGIGWVHHRDLAGLLRGTGEAAVVSSEPLP